MKSISESAHGATLALRPTAADSKSQQRRAPGPRRQEIEADHRQALSRAYSYQAQRARSAEELEILDREYRRRMEEGPDFTRYRTKSQFGDAPRHGLDRNALARLRFMFNSMARGAWQQRKPGNHRGVISRTCRDVFGAFLYLAERYDRLFPSLERIAHLAQCCKQSVVTALDMLERLGFITRHRRLRMVEGVLGRKAEQTTNAYELHGPRTAWGAAALALFSSRSESNNWSAIDTACFKYLRETPETWGGTAAFGVGSGGPP